MLRACPDMLDHAPHGIRHWHELVATAATVRGYMGISPDAWEEACRILGAGHAAVVIACLLQRAETIARPGGYLRALSTRAANGSFSTGPMVMALLRAENRRAA
ncbi:replication initiation protein RepC [Frigidibacter sp. MR17.24]|uniref:replication initiation protein RepC n=1 Tax=Frigidibacter sp. MR17.24 TaxID=3127345 RepID=UPI003012D42B